MVRMNSDNNTTYINKIYIVKKGEKIDFRLFSSISIHTKFHIYRHFSLNLRKPNVCNIRRLVLVRLLVFALICILNVLVALVRLDTMDDIQPYHVHRNNVVRIPLNSLEYRSNCRNIGHCIHKFRCRYIAFFLYVLFEN